MRKIIFTMLPLFFVFLLMSCPGGDKGREYRQLKNVQATLSKVGTAGQENTVNVKASLDNEKYYFFSIDVWVKSNSQNDWTYQKISYSLPEDAEVLEYEKGVTLEFREDLQKEIDCALSFSILQEGSYVVNVEALAYGKLDDGVIEEAHYSEAFNILIR